MNNSRIFKMPFSSVYPLYIQKVERKGFAKGGVDRIIYWLTGYDELGLKKQLDNNCSFETFFAEAPLLNPNASLIKGVICGYRIEEIEDELMRKIRFIR